MGFFKKKRSGPKVGHSQNEGKKGSSGYGPQHSILGNGGTNGKVPITKKAKNILDN